jgi:hypothetical protein
MARARNIKPGFFKNEELAELGPLAMLLFEGLWCLADKEGRLEDRPKRIKAETFPYFEADVDALLNGLANRGFILRYMVEERRYIQVVNWHHQRPHSNETASVIPPCDDGLPIEEHGLRTKVDSAADQGEQDFGLIPDTLLSDTPLSESPLTEAPAARGREIYPPDFEAFWKRYPSGHGNKVKAGAAWSRMSRDDRRAAEDGLEKWLRCDRWKRGLVKSADVWLRDRWWADEPPPSDLAARASPVAAPVRGARAFEAAIERARERDEHDAGRNGHGTDDDRHALLADGQHRGTQHRPDDRDLDEGPGRHAIETAYRERP